MARYLRRSTGVRVQKPSLVRLKPDAPAFIMSSGV